MTILYIAGGGIAENTGMGRIAAQWKQAFERKGHQVDVLDTEQQFGHWHPLWRGFPLRQHLKRLPRPDLLLVHEPLGGWVSTNRVPMVVFSHGLEERAWQVQQQFHFRALSSKARLLPDALRFFSHHRGFRSAAGVLLSNHADEVYFRKRFPKKPLMVFRNGVFNFSSENKHNPSKIICVWNATWLPRKGTALLVEAFSALLPKQPQVVLRLAGTGRPAAELHALFPANVHQQVEVCAAHEPKNEAAIYAGASIFLLPSFFEGQSLALQQAMYMGLCPVATDNSGQSDLIKHGINGLLFPTGSLEGFTSALQQLITHPDDALRMGLAAQKTVSSFHWSGVSDAVVAFCESCL